MKATLQEKAQDLPQTVNIPKEGACFNAMINAMINGMICGFSLVVVNLLACCSMGGTAQAFPLK